MAIGDRHKTADRSQRVDVYPDSDWIRIELWTTMIKIGLHFQLNQLIKSGVGIKNHHRSAWCLQEH